MAVFFISVGASSVNFGGKTFRHFARKYMYEKLTKGAAEI